MAATIKSKSLADKFTPIDKGGARFFEKVKEHIKEMVIGPTLGGTAYGLIYGASIGSITGGVVAGAGFFIGGYIGEFVNKKLSKTEFGKKHGYDKTVSRRIVEGMKKLKRSNDK